MANQKKAGSTPATAPEQAAAEPQLTGHEYDGITEYDNPLPAWWVNIFWATFVFAIGYLFHYHLSGKGPSVIASYAAELEQAREIEAARALGDQVSEESLAALTNNAALMADASNLFHSRCAACHLESGQGAIGPNLTDGYWIHGRGKLMDLYSVVNDGVPAKGMPAWGRQLAPIELAKVVAFVGTLRNTNVPGKAAEGTKIAGR